VESPARASTRSPKRRSDGGSKWLKASPAATPTRITEKANFQRKLRLREARERKVRMRFKAGGGSVGDARRVGASDEFAGNGG
jgi:hypothetical protein